MNYCIKNISNSAVNIDLIGRSEDETFILEPNEILFYDDTIDLPSSSTLYLSTLNFIQIYEYDEKLMANVDWSREGF